MLIGFLEVMVIPIVVSLEQISAEIFLESRMTPWVRHLLANHGQFGGGQGSGVTAKDVEP